MTTISYPIPEIPSHLLTLNHSLHKSATQHPFLLLAGRGTLPKYILSQWLAQDRLYALAYEKFITTLQETHSQEAESRKSNPDDDVEIREVLKKAHTGIEREIKFFAEVVKQYTLEIGSATASETETPPSQAVIAYTGLFEKCSSNVLDGLTLLWATERCYLDAWSFAAKQEAMDAISGGKKRLNESEADLDGGALREKLIPNWSGEDFVAFVYECEAALERAWRAEAEAGVGTIREKLVRAEGLWRKVLEVEAMFWPDVAHLI